MTILLSNVLDNAVRAAAEFGEANPETCPEIRFTADRIGDQFAIQIENSCLAVSRSDAVDSEAAAGRDGWLSADAFLSTHRGGGYGLKRVEMITAKYEGYAWFSFDPDRHLLITRLMLRLSEV